MSRIGKQPINLTPNVEVQYTDTVLTVKGNNGTLTLQVPLNLGLKVDSAEKKIILKPDELTNKTKSLWGLYRTLINNMVYGVSTGFTKVLEVNGVGYKLSIDNKFLTLSLGYSHEIKVAIPDKIKLSSPKAGTLVIFGSNKETVGQFASLIRSLRKPEPYKGKGVMYEGEKIRRKEGKKK